MKRPAEVTEFLRCGGPNCNDACSSQFDKLGVEDCQTWRVHGYVQQLEKRVVHLEALNQQNLSVITMQERTRARLEEQISQLEARVPRWISVEERLPEKMKHVLVFKQRNGHALWPIAEWHIEIDWRGEDGWSKNLDNGYFDITHWAPLPEPPNRSE